MHKRQSVLFHSHGGATYTASARRTFIDALNEGYPLELSGSHLVGENWNGWTTTR